MPATLNEVLPLIKEYLKLSKDLAQLLEGDNSLIHCYNEATHRLHGKCDTLGAGTGRFTHSLPNITQVPKDPEFRKLLCVPDNKLFVDVDADALELVMLGHYLAPYDNCEFAKAVSEGDKDKGTDIHTLNQKRVGLPSRDAAKTFIYANNYGAGATKLGDMCWDKQPFTYTQAEYIVAKEAVAKRVIKIEGKEFFPIEKGVLTPLRDELILATIYGSRITKAFRDNTKGYKELLTKMSEEGKKGYIKAIDGRRLYLRSEHKALNLLIQSAGAIFMKYYLVAIDEELNKHFTHGKEYAYVANIHDAVNLEIIPEVKDKVKEILTNGFKIASDRLGLIYAVKGEPHFGKNQQETH